MPKGTKKMLNYLLVILYVLAGSLGMVLIKKGGGNSGIVLGGAKINISMSMMFIVGMLLYLCSFLLWIYILQVFSLTYISPVSYGLVFIATAIFSHFILNDTISKEQIVGAILIVSGIIFASKK
ncbi:MAG: hypothetical protein J6J42_04395 [Lachnospiraceae bacterium]|nr:hypothetical protein [Lachnospiraceae bacterium]